MKQKTKSEQMKYILERNSSSTIFARYARHLLENNELHDALMVAEHGVRLNPTYVTGHITLSDIYRADNDYRQAIQELATALRSEPNHIGALRRVAEILSDSEGENDVIEGIYELLHRINPNLKMLKKKSFQDKGPTIATILKHLEEEHEQRAHLDVAEAPMTLDGIIDTATIPLQTAELELAPLDATVAMTSPGTAEAPQEVPLDMGDISTPSEVTPDIALDLSSGQITPAPLDEAPTLEANLDILRQESSTSVESLFASTDATVELDNELIANAIPTPSTDEEALGESAPNLDDLVSELHIHEEEGEEDHEKATADLEAVFGSTSDNIVAETEAAASMFNNADATVALDDELMANIDEEPAEAEHAFEENPLADLKETLSESLSVLKEETPAQPVDESFTTSDEMSNNIFASAGATVELDRETLNAALDEPATTPPTAYSTPIEESSSEAPVFEENPFDDLKETFTESLSVLNDETPSFEQPPAKEQATPENMFGSSDATVVLDDELLASIDEPSATTPAKEITPNSNENSDFLADAELPTAEEIPTLEDSPLDNLKETFTESLSALNDETPPFEQPPVEDQTAAENMFSSTDATIALEDELMAEIADEPAASPTTEESHSDDEMSPFDDIKNTISGSLSVLGTDEETPEIQEEPQNFRLSHETLESYKDMPSSENDFAFGAEVTDTPAPPTIDETIFQVSDVVGVGDHQDEKTIAFAVPSSETPLPAPEPPTQSPFQQEPVGTESPLGEAFNDSIDDAFSALMGDDEATVTLQTSETFNNPNATPIQAIIPKPQSEPEPIEDTVVESPQIENPFLDDDAPFDVAEPEDTSLPQTIEEAEENEEFDEEPNSSSIKDTLAASFFVDEEPEQHDEEIIDEAYDLSTPADEEGGEGTTQIKESLASSTDSTFVMHDEDESPAQEDITPQSNQSPSIEEHIFTNSSNDEDEGTTQINGSTPDFSNTASTTEDSNENPIETALEPASSKNLVIEEPIIDLLADNNGEETANIDSFTSNFSDASALPEGEIHEEIVSPNAFTPEITQELSIEEVIIGSLADDKPDATEQNEETAIDSPETSLGIQVDDEIDTEEDVTPEIARESERDESTYILDNDTDSVAYSPKAPFGVLTDDETANEEDITPEVAQETDRSEATYVLDNDDTDSATHTPEAPFGVLTDDETATEEDVTPEVAQESTYALANDDEDEATAHIEEILSENAADLRENVEVELQEELIQSDEPDAIVDASSGDDILAEETPALSSDSLPDHVITPTYADLYLKQDQPQMALSIYERILQKNPDDESAYVNWSRIKRELAEQKILEEQPVVEQAVPQKRRQKATKPLAGKRIKKEIRRKLKGKGNAEK